MGHGPTPVQREPSEPTPAIQWPLPPDPAPAAARRLRLGVMASGSGSNFEALVKACQQGHLPAEVSLLVVNNPGCGAQERAARLGVPCVVHDHHLAASREALDQALIESFQAAGVDLVVMAGWMSIVTPVLLDAYPDKVINLHPSLLPAFPGMRAVEQAVEYGVRVFGVTVHLVDNGVDTGAIILQRAIELPEMSDPTEVHQILQGIEHELLPEAVRLLARGAVTRDPDNPRRLIVTP